MLRSIRQARDDALARASDAAERLRQSEQHLAWMEDQLASARESYVQASQRETEIRRERDNLHLQVLELKGQKLASLEAEWKVATALIEVRKDLAIAIGERDNFRQQLLNLEAARRSVESHAGENDDRSSVQQIGSLRGELSALSLEVSTLKALLSERDAKLEAQEYRFEEERDILTAQLIALRSVEDLSDEPDTIIPFEAEPEQSGFNTVATPPTITATLGELRDVTASLIGSEADIERLDRLRTVLSSVEEWANEERRIQLHRITRATLELVLWLRNSPTKIAAHLAHLLEGLRTIPVTAQVREESLALNGNIYTVDDDLDNCECIAMALQKFDLAAEYSAQPQRALKKLSEETFDLIFLDFDMPGMNGIELLQALRLTATNKDTPVLFVSALESTKDLLHKQADPNVEFIGKPYNLTTLCLRAMTLMLRPCLKM
jgi:CheY-like chemotaxis protein